MPARVKAIINPALISWARDSAGFTVAEAAQKLGIEEERLAGWEDLSVEDGPSIPQRPRAHSRSRRQGYRTSAVRTRRNRGWLPHLANKSDPRTRSTREAQLPRRAFQAACSALYDGWPRCIDHHTLKAFCPHPMSAKPEYMGSSALSGPEGRRWQTVIAKTEITCAISRPQLDRIVFRNIYPIGKFLDHQTFKVKNRRTHFIVGAKSVSVHYHH